MKARWKLTKFVCPDATCSRGIEDAEHSWYEYQAPPTESPYDRRPRCPAHNLRMEIFEEIPLFTPFDVKDILMTNERVEDGTKTTI